MMELNRPKRMADEGVADYSSSSQHRGNILRTLLCYLFIILFQDLGTSCAYSRMFTCSAFARVLEFMDLFASIHL